MHVLWGYGTPLSTYETENLETTWVTFCQMRTQMSPQQEIISFLFHGFPLRPEQAWSWWHWAGSCFHRPQQLLRTNTGHPRRRTTCEEERRQFNPRLGPLTPHRVRSLQEVGWLSLREMLAQLGRQTPEVFVSSQGLHSFVVWN